MKLGNKILGAIISAGIGLGTAGQSKADIAEGINTGIPGQIQLNAVSSHADKFTDSEGNEKKIDNNAEVITATLKLKGTKDALGIKVPYYANLSVPHVSLINNFTGQKVSGLGDISIEAGLWQKYNAGGNWNLHLLETLGVKVPTGEYNQKSKMNLGTGQYDISTILRGTLTDGDYFIDGKIAGAHRTGQPSDRLDLSATLAKRVLDTKYGNLILGAEANASHSQDAKNVNARVIGRFTLKDGIQINVWAGQDLYERNSPERDNVGVTVRIPMDKVWNYVKGVFK